MLGPFKIIKETKSPLAYVLDLPPSMSLLHPTFHVSLLEPVKDAHDNQPQDPPPIIEVEGEQEYTIDRILNSRINPDDDGFDYLVHWKDFSSDNDSWEPWENVHDTLAFRSFERLHKNDHNHVFPSTFHKRKRNNQKQVPDSTTTITTEPNMLRRSKRHKQQ